MKKLLNKLGLLSMGMAFSFIMFSCSASMDSLLDDLEKASNKGNEEQLNKITEKIAARADELTYEQAKRFYDIFDEYGGYFDWGIPIGLDKTLDKILSTEKENGLIEPLEAEEREPFDALEAEDPIELDDDIDDYEETSSSDDWDSVLDDYEEYVDSYIRLFKKAQNGDLSAMSEYASMLDKANSLSNKLEKAEDSMTSKQLARYEKITLKMASVATY